MVKYRHDFMALCGRFPETRNFREGLCTQNFKVDMQKHKTSDVVFSCSKLNKEFLTRGKNITVLQDLTFSVSQGEFICVVGPSGCGKSTLLRIIAELIPMT